GAVLTPLHPLPACILFSASFAVASTLTPVAPAPAVSSEAVQVDVRLTQQDLFRAELTSVWRQTRLFYLITAMIVLGTAVRWRSLAILLGSAILFALLNGLLFILMRFNAASTLRSNRVLRGVMRYSFDNEGVHLRGETFWGRFGWANVYDVLETPHLILIRPAYAQKYILPKRFFETHDLEKLRGLFRAHVKGALALRSGGGQ